MRIREILDLAIESIIQMENPLLVFDEGDKLNDNVFHYFINLYNRLEGKCGITFLSTDYIQHRIDCGLNHNRKGYNEIYSRIGRKFFELEPTSCNDVFAICQANASRFPAGHLKGGQLTGFPEKVIKGTKIHTFREDPGKWAYNVELINSHNAELSIRRWIGRPYHTPQLEVKRLKKIGIQQVQMTWDSDIEQPTVFIDGKRILNVEQLAANDGMTLDDFVSWFFKTSNTFEGVIIHFTDFRY